MKVLLWIGSQANQTALANKIAGEFEVVGIVCEKRSSQRRLGLKKIVQAVIEKIFLSPINEAWANLQNGYSRQYPELPKTDLIEVENINSEEAYHFSTAKNFDIIAVSGTRLVKQKMLSIPSPKGILNLHTGISPYVKGGPNCTNWCIANGDFHLVGNTIMWIDAGIDSGNLVTTESSPINWMSSLSEIHSTVMEHAHELYVKALKYIRDGGVSNFEQQQIGEGKVYYTKDWKLNKKFDLMKNLNRLKKDKGLEQIEEMKKKIKLIHI